MKLQILIATIVLSTFLFLSPLSAAAQGLQQTEVKGTVVEITNEENKVYENGRSGKQQELKIELTDGSHKGETITTTYGEYETIEKAGFEVGDKLLLYEYDTEDGLVYQIFDYQRTLPLAALFIIFAVLAVLIGGKVGFQSLIGLLISFILIFKFIVPWVDEGVNPILVSLLGGTAIAAVSYFVSHGPSKKTVIAFCGTIVALFITGGVGYIFLNWGQITGGYSEEIGYLLSMSTEDLAIFELIFAGIIISSLGVLDDITISQSSVVQEIKHANPSFNPREVFNRSMRVGRDHIGSLINTLVLVYVGASLPLILLFTKTDKHFTEILNYEIVAIEIIKMLVASIGLITAVPITTLLAVKFLKGKEGDGHGHVH